MSKTQKGFTLVELAIALMVIGLLIGGVLKGQELIENARVTKAMRQIKAYDAAVMIFRSTYNAFPGDIRNPGTRIPSCTAAACNRAGNGDSRVDGLTTTGMGGSFGHEMLNFFPHLTMAGMIQGPLGGTFTGAITALSWAEYEQYYPIFFDEQNYMRVQWNGVDIHEISLGGTKPKRAAQLDRKIDDGMPEGGEMRSRSIVMSLPGAVYCEKHVSGVVHYDESSSGVCHMTLVASF